MELTIRELWTVIHGLILGAIYLLAFAGGVEGLWAFRDPSTPMSELNKRLTRLRVGLWVMALASWATVITGTYVVYPWYREKIPTSLEASFWPIRTPLNGTHSVWSGKNILLGLSQSSLPWSLFLSHGTAWNSSNVKACGTL